MADHGGWSGFCSGVVSLTSRPSWPLSGVLCADWGVVARIGGVSVMFAGVCWTWEVVMDRWTVTVEEAAQMLGISRSSAYGCVRRGELRALRLGRRLVVPRSALEELLGGSPVSVAAPGDDGASC